MIRLGKKYQLLLQKSREMNCSLLREDSTEGGRKKSQLGSSWGLERTKSRAFFLPEWALPFPSRKAVFLSCDLGFVRLPLDSAILDLSSGLCSIKIKILVLSSGLFSSTLDLTFSVHPRRRYTKPRDELYIFF